MPTEILPGVPYALGQVSSRHSQIVTVQFSDIAANPAHLRGASRTFKVDIGHQDHKVGDWVVASWKRGARTDKSTGALLVQGAVGTGCSITPISKVAQPAATTVFTPFAPVPKNAMLRSPAQGADDLGARTFLQVAARQLSTQLEQRSQAPQNKRPGPDPTSFLSVVDPTIIPKSTGPTPPWLPVPVPILGGDNEWGAPDSYIRIGYVSFTVDSPVEEIRIEETSPSKSIQTLRSRTSIQKDNWHAQQQVTITMTLHGREAINEVLLPLVRLFKRAPFLPVYNRLLFDADITALSLQSLQTSTIPGYPNSLKAVLVCWAFNWEVYLPLAHEAHGLDSLFCYPLLKIWAEKPYPHTFSPKKIDSQWDGQFRMFHPSESWLKQTTGFPNVAARARHLNDDIDALELASLWSRDHGLADQSGFKLGRAFPNLGGIQKGSTQIFTLDSTIGRMIVGHSSYTFLRITDVAMARQIASSRDCVNILKGEVNVARHPGQPHDPLGSGESPALVNTEEIAGSPSQLVHLIDVNDKTSIDYIKAGHYCFMVHMHSPLFSRLAQQRRPTKPIAPSDSPLIDQGDPFTPPSMVIEQISCSMDNIIVPLQVRGKASATHQYMGSNCLSFQVIGTLQNYADLNQIKRFMERVHELGRDYKGKLDGTPFGGFCVVDNEIFHMMGVRHVLPISWEATTIPDFPDGLRFVITVVEFDVTQRRKEVIQDLMKGVETNRMLSVRSDHDQINVNWIRQGDLNPRLRGIELYPDLALPTHTELAAWIKAIQEDRVWDWENARAFPGYEYLDPENGGSGWQWSQQERKNRNGGVIADRLPETFMGLKMPGTHPDRFADPDFYCAPSQKWGIEMVEGVIEGSKVNPVVMSDSYGTEVEIAPGQHLNEDLVKRKGKDHQDTLGQGQSAINAGTHPQPIGASAGLVDQALSGRLSGLPLDQELHAGNAALIPSVPDTHNIKKGAPRPTVAVDDSGSQADRYNRYAPVAAAAAEAYNIPKDWFFGLIELESAGWHATAVDGVIGTHKGLGQLSPDAQKRFGVTDPFNPTQNAFAAARYLRILLNMFHGDENLAIGAYNQGEGTIQRAGGLTPKAAKYVAQVRARQTHYVHDKDHPDPKYLAQPAFDPLIKVQMQQAFKQFNSGLGYPKEELKEYILGTPFTDIKKAFIPIDWLKPVFDGVDLSAPSDVGTILNASGYQIKAKFLPTFLAEVKKRKLQFSFVEQNLVVPGKYSYEEGYDSLPYHPPTIHQSFHDPKNHRDIWHDLREELICGRLLGAFPTFYVALIDGGRRLRIYRMFDHLYGMQAVTQIAVHRTRKGPVETAVVNFSNMYGHLTAQVADQARINSLDTRGTWGLEAVYRGFQSFVRIDDETLVEWAQAVDTLFLKPGARLHIRMGYGSDCSRLPVVFNGVISEVPVSEGELQVVALSDGIELTNDLAPTDLQGSMPVTRLNGFLGEGMNPREIVTTYMAPNPTLHTAQNIAATALEFYGATSLAGLIYPKTTNAYGIEHFGSPVRSQLGFDDGEIGVNLYNPESSAPYSNSSAWDNTLRIFQFWRWDKNKGLIGINMAQATPWQIFESCRKTVPDYLLYSSPFETRSTLFFGKGWFPLFYAYKDDLPDFTPDVIAELPREALMEYKPFQQVHLITSDWNLLANDVRADATDMATQVQAVGTYNGWLPGSSDLSNEASFVMMIDSDIWAEHQRLKLVESGLYADVNMKFGDANSDEGGPARVLIGLVMTAAGIVTLNPTLAVGGLAALAEGPIRSFLFSRRVEDFFAAATLKDYVKDMYQGHMTLLGNPYIKPFDLLSVADNLSGLNGLCETKSVTHTMSLETGYVTVVEPDCISTFLDFEGRDLLLWAMLTGGHLIGAVGMASALGALARRGSKAVLLRGIRRLSKWVDAEVKRLASGREPTSELFQKMTIQEAQEVARDLKLEVDETVKAVSQGNTARLREIIAAISDKNAAARTAASAGGATARQILDAAPKEIQAEIHLQNALRGLPQTEGVKNTVKLAGKAVDKVKGVVGEKVTQNMEALDRLTHELETKHNQLRGFGRTEEEIAQLVKDAKEGAKLVGKDAQLVKVAEEVASLEKQWKVSSFARTTVNLAPETAELLAGLSKQIFSRCNIFAAIIGVANIGAGCLSDYITRVMAARQCLTIFPLKMYGTNLEAGITGHRGAVVGDRLGQLDTYLQNTIEFWGRPYLNLIAPFIPVLGDVVTSGINYRAPEVPSFIGDNTTGRGYPDHATTSP
jgi:hypothetical protein